MLGIVLPAKNEAAALPELLGRPRSVYPHAEIPLIDNGLADVTVLSTQRRVGRISKAYCAACSCTAAASLHILRGAPQVRSAFLTPFWQIGETAG